MKLILVLAFLIAVPVFAEDTINLLGPHDVIAKEVQEASIENLINYYNACKAGVAELEMTKPPYGTPDWYKWKERANLIYRDLYLIKTEMDLRELHLRD